MNQTELRIQYKKETGDHPTHEYLAFHENRWFKKEYTLWLEEELIHLSKQLQSINLSHQDKHQS